MKKIISIILIICLICSACTSIIGCDRHEHIFDQQILQDEYKKCDADYKNPKTYYYVCACGEMSDKTFTIGEKVPCPGHHAIWVTDKTPSCFEDGSKHSECKYCGQVFLTETLPMVDHEYKNYKCIYCQKSSLIVGLDYVLNDSKDGYIVNDFGMTSNYNVVIPDTYNNLPIVAIGKNAFRKKHITSIIISDSVTKIDNGAFEHCYYLKSVSANNVEHVGFGAFSNCKELVSINLGDNLKTINSFAFENCVKLASIRLQPNLTLGEDIFSGCKALTYNQKGELLYIGNDDYKYTYLMGVTDKNIAVANVDDSCQVIYNGAFANCTYLKDVALPQGLNTIDNYAFKNCQSLESLQIPNTVTSINTSAFEFCTSLDQLVLSDSLEFVGNNAFKSCNALKSITFNGSVQYFGQNAFVYCYNLNNVYFSGGVDQWVAINFVNPLSNPLYFAKNLYINNTLLTSATITAEQVSPYAFFNYKHLESLTLSSSVIKIDKYAFYGCDTIQNLNLSNGITSIGDFAFANCANIKTLAMPDSLTKIGENAFYNCTSLISVVISKNLSHIGISAFSKCSSLESMRFSNTYSWYYTLSEEDWSNKNGGTKYILSDDLSNAMTLAYAYDNYYWYKK